MKNYFIVLECDVNPDGTRGPYKKVKSGFDESKLESECNEFNKTNIGVKFRYVKKVK